MPSPFPEGKHPGGEPILLQVTVQGVQTSIIQALERTLRDHFKGAV